MNNKMVGLDPNNLEETFQEIADALNEHTEVIQNITRVMGKTGEMLDEIHKSMLLQKELNEKFIKFMKIVAEE